VQIGHGSRGGIIAGGLALACVVVTAGCGSSTKAATTPTPTPTPTPSPTLAESPSPSPSTTPSPGATPTNTASATLSRGAKTPSCVNGWVQPAPGADFYRQATDALQASQGGTGYTVKTVRYFAGPLANGILVGVYYLDVRDPRLSARVLLVSGAGPESAAVARTGSRGWKAGDWFGFKGTDPPAQAPLPGIAHPGKWAGPEYDPVGGTTALLSPSLTGCLDGT
jgi:hypothetical protein